MWGLCLGGESACGSGQVTIETPMAEEMRLHGSAKLVTPSPAMTVARANAWVEPDGR